jgi:hypothetical protein
MRTRDITRAIFTMAMVVAGALTLATPASAADRTEAAPFDSRSSFLIRNVMTDMCIDLPGSGDGHEGGTVAQWDCRPGNDDNQRFWFVSTNDRGDAFAIMNARDSLCLDVPGNGAVRPGTPVTEYRCILGERDNQMFEATGGRSKFMLRHVKSNMCLDVEGAAGSGGRDAKMLLWPCDRRDDHYWTTTTR